MDISYLMIACSPEALAVGLNTVRSHPYIQITLDDVPQATYLGFALYADLLVVMNFAKRNQYSFQELSEGNMRDMNFQKGTFKIKGDRRLASWLRD